MYSQARYPQVDYYEDQGGYKPQRGCYDAQPFNVYNYGGYREYNSSFPRRYRPSQEKNQPRNSPLFCAQYDDQEMAYDNYGHPRGNKSHYEEPQDHYQDQYEGYEDYIPQKGYNDAQSYGLYPTQAPPIEDEYHNTPSQNLYSQKAYTHNSYSKNIQYSRPPQNEKYFPFTQKPQYPQYSQDHQDYLYYDHYEDREYMMQPYEEESKEDMRNKILAMLEELKQDITHMRQECKQEIMQEFATQRQEISSLWQETQVSIRNLEDQITQVVMWENEWENTCVEERNVGNGVVEKEIKEESGEDDEDVQIVCGDELYFGKTLEAQCEVVDMTRDINYTIEDVEDAFVEPSSDEIGFKEHDDFCNDPSVDFRDDDCKDACNLLMIRYLLEGGTLVEKQFTSFDYHSKGVPPPSNSYSCMI
nr:uncharacterized protein LOC109169483 [Ipomoea batatas]